MNFKFKVGERVRVTTNKKHLAEINLGEEWKQESFFNKVGTITEIDPRNSKFRYTVVFGENTHWQFNDECLLRISKLDKILS